MWHGHRRLRNGLFLCRQKMGMLLCLCSRYTDVPYHKILRCPNVLFATTQVRPLDVILATASSTNGGVQRQISCCGCGWGIPGDIAAEQESLRWLKKWRYAWLKVYTCLFWRLSFCCSIRTHIVWWLVGWLVGWRGGGRRSRRRRGLISHSCDLT
jgi:hypothetical protein